MKLVEGSIGDMGNGDGMLFVVEDRVVFGLYVGIGGEGSEKVWNWF